MKSFSVRKGRGAHEKDKCEEKQFFSSASLLSGPRRKKKTVENLSRAFSISQVRSLLELELFVIFSVFQSSRTCEVIRLQKRRDGSAGTYMSVSEI